MTTKKVAAKKARIEPVSVIAYKGFDKDLKCRGFQFEVGKTYKHEGTVKACESGFHACENPFDVWNYYDLTDNRFAIVSVSGELSRHGDDLKIAAGEITVTSELRLPDFINAGINYLLSLTKDVDKSVTVDSGNDSQLAASGYGSQVTLGKNGAACLPFHHGTRCRFVSIYEGENGIKAGVAYCLNPSGQVVKVQP